MAKYIDLLRAHQNKPSPATTALADTSFDSHNHLSMPENPDAFNDLIQDQTSEFEVVSNSPVAADSLLAEEPCEPIKDNKNIFVSTGSSKESDNNCIDWLYQCAELITDIFQKAKKEEASSIQDLAEHISQMLERMANDDALIDTLELDISSNIKKISLLDSDLGSLTQKSIMMMLYTIKIVHRLKLHHDEARSHILAAILHHIGMAQVPSEIRHKKDRLSQSEIKEIRQAPAKGHEYLQQCGITDTCILLAALQAQERFDGSGALGLSGSDIAYSARMTGLVSLFEALIHYRPYRNRLLPRDAIRELINQHKKAFDITMLKALIESISLYPVGCFVQLNSGDVGQVIRVNPRLPLRPHVIINLDSQGNDIPPREISLKEQPNLMVQRCMYEENLAELKESVH